MGVRSARLDFPPEPTREAEAWILAGKEGPSHTYPRPLAGREDGPELRHLGRAHSLTLPLARQDGRHASLRLVAGPASGRSRHLRRPYLALLTVILEMAFQRLHRLDLAELGQVQWEKVFDASSEMFVFHERNGRVSRVNLSVSSFLGRPIASCIGARCEDLFPDLCACHDSAERRWIDPASGRVFQVSTQVVAVGRGTAVLHVLNEVTQQLKLQELALQRDHMEFSAKLLEGVAHEIRNPVFALSTVTQALERELGPDSTVAPHLGHILEQVRRMDALVKRFLSISFAPPPSGGSPRLATEVVARALDLVSERCPPGSRERVAVRVEEEGLLLPASDAPLPAALFDLIENALHFSPPELPVEVSVGRRGGSVVVEVRDRGPGLTPEARANLFVPFFTTRPGRTGLGLASAKAAVTRLGGSIEAPQGEASPGAVFLIAFPAGSEP